MTEREQIALIGKRLDARLALAVDPPTQEEIEAARKKRRKRKHGFPGFRRRIAQSVKPVFL